MKITVNQDQQVQKKAKYNQIFILIKKKIKAVFVVFSFIASVVLVIYITQKATLQKQEQRSQAAIGEREVSISLYPVDISCNSNDKNIFIYPKITYSASKKVGFVKLAITFDPTLLNFISVSYNSQTDNLHFLKSALDNKSPNQTNLIMLFGADDVNIAPSSVANLSKINFQIIKPLTNKIIIDKTASQIVFVDNLQGEIKDMTEVSVNCNTVPSPTNIQPSPTVLFSTPTVTATPAVNITLPVSSPTMATSIIPTVVIVSPTAIILPTATPTYAPTTQITSSLQ